ncbi:hypothetical protein [Paludifilum halophilum]|uniref:Uncharacterized protein n=1 Tax=Paludifilum halophilum TaxID=1642702 RepID=A0A235B4N1_9BACL|nr:hypothetical protein [Paludifilum halophilum]OYD06575.1 hypothetical protein CHM34_15900 [Paludifilum halophilum]
MYFDFYHMERNVLEKQRELITDRSTPKRIRPSLFHRIWRNLRHRQKPVTTMNSDRACPLPAAASNSDNLLFLQLYRGDHRRKKREKTHRKARGGTE